MKQPTPTKKTSCTYCCGALLLSLALVACGPNEPEAMNSESGPGEGAETLFVAEAPADALTVIEARAQLAPGDPAVVWGQIGGVLEPFLSGYAGFVLGDTEIVFCNEMGDDDHCSTPWDACCEDKEQLQGRRISVQFVDANGNPIEGSLRESHSLKELDTVTVIGTVAETSTAENMIIYAEKMARL